MSDQSLVTEPLYRVRLFVSVDLSGSTAFKAQQSRDATWIKHFYNFYSGFYSQYTSNFLEFCQNNPDETSYFVSETPKIWKTIGDEIVFVNRVRSHYQIYAYIIAFKRTLESYSAQLKESAETSSLDVKGNAWLASFPTPNRTISVQLGTELQDEVPLDDEDRELKADETPSDFEFLGRGIDAGFRINTNSRPAFFTISPMLARSLCRAHLNSDYRKFSVELRFEGVNSLKGVNGGENYPTIGIITERSPAKKRLGELQRKLDGSSTMDYQDLSDYLDKLAEVYTIEEPTLKVSPTSPEIASPRYYTEVFVTKWRKDREEQVRRAQTFAQSAEHSDGRELFPGELAEIEGQLTSRPFKDD